MKKELNKKRKRVSQINLTNTKKYCKTDSLFLHLGLQNSDWSFCFETPGPLGQQSSWLIWYLGFYLITSTVNPELLRSGSVIQRVSNQTWKRNLQKQTQETLIWKCNIWKCNIEDSSWTHTHTSVKSKSSLLGFFTASTHIHTQFIIIIIIIYYFVWNIQKVLESLLSLLLWQ